jgi:hypothetical protein
MTFKAWMSDPEWRTKSEDRIVPRKISMSRKIECAMLLSGYESTLWTENKHERRF